MKGFVIAVQFLTRLPTPRIAVSREEFAASMRWFPAVGLVVGLILALGVWAGASLDPWLGALVGVLLWVAITGGLHLDGLGDIADACGAAHKDRDRLLAVLADPHVGSFAVIVITLQLATKLVLLRLLLAGGGWLLPIVAIPFAARIAPLVWTRWLPALHEGLGAKFRSGFRGTHIAVWIVLLLVASWFVPALLAATPFVVFWGGFIKRRIGGISGDGHGAGIEVVESGLLLACLVWAMLS